MKRMDILMTREQAVINMKDDQVCTVVCLGNALCQNRHKGGGRKQARKQGRKERKGRKEGGREEGREGGRKEREKEEEERKKER